MMKTKLRRFFRVVASAMIESHRNQFAPSEKLLTGITPNLYNGGITI